MVLPFEEASFYEPFILQDHAHHTCLDLVSLLSCSLDLEHSTAQASLFPLCILDVLREELGWSINLLHISPERPLNRVRDLIDFIKPFLKHIYGWALEALPDAGLVYPCANWQGFQAVTDLNPSCAFFLDLLMETAEDCFSLFILHITKLFLKLFHLLLVHWWVRERMSIWPIFPVVFVLFEIGPKNLLIIFSLLPFQRLKPNKEESFNLRVSFIDRDLRKIIAPTVP